MELGAMQRGEKTNMATVKPVPGSYGLPLLGAAWDRLNFFYRQGEVEFFKSRAKKYGSTVFRVNFVPSPPGFPDPRGVALVDNKSFRVLFDNTKVNKANVFIGPYSPSSSFTGGYRPLAYLDTEEPKHKVLKQFAFEVVRSRGKSLLEHMELRFKAGSFIEQGDKELATRLAEMSFEFLADALVPNAAKPMPASEAIPKLKSWIALQFAPVAPPGSTGLPAFLEDLALRTIPLPSLLVRSSYKDLSAFFSQAVDILDMAEKQFGIDRDEALHNLVFLASVNAWLGFSKLLPTVLYYAAVGGREFQLQLGEEIRTAMAGNSTSSSASRFMAALPSMPLLQSTMVEILRIAPPVLYQYGRARQDFVVESQGGDAFQIRKGDLLGGSQALACRDPAIFDKPDSFQPGRFLGNPQLMDAVFWSNGRQGDSPSENNKQCAGKDMVQAVLAYFLVLLFQEFQSMELEVGATPSTPVLKSITRLKHRI